MSVQSLGILVLVALSQPTQPASTSALCSVEGLDSDHDRLTDECELALAKQFAPILLVSANACNWDSESGRLAGAYFFGAEPTALGVRLVYLPAYFEDCGWSGPKCLLRLRGGCDPHAGDSEAVFVDIVKQVETGDWLPDRVFLSAHCFSGSDGDCRWFAAEEVQWSGSAPVVWVAEGKNANYASKSSCDAGHWLFDTCDRNDRSVRFPVESMMQNIGSAEAPFPDHREEPACVGADEILSSPEVVGTECLWTSARFRGWAGPDVDGATGYRRYLEQVAGFAVPSSPGTS